jgi:CRISPR system Cascade subunit CasC
MFGRMTTSAAFEDVQASIQVAHALATNELVRVYDFFTAVDDLKSADADADAGAGMLGDVELNSSTYYKYFNIHWEGLINNLDGDETVAAEAVAAFVESAVFAQPSGKQNSTAANNLPDFVLVEVSDKNIPVNYGNAFLKPAQSNHTQSMMQNAIQKLDGYGARLRKVYGLDNKLAYFSVEETAVQGAEDVESLPNLKQWVNQQIMENTHA